VLTKKKNECAAFAWSGKTAASQAPRSSPLAKRSLWQGAMRDGCFRRLAFAKQYLKEFWLTVSCETTYSLDSNSIPVINSYPPNATRSHTLLEKGFLMSYRL